MSKICSECGSYKYYAKGLCKRCYSRQYDRQYYYNNIEKVKTRSAIKRLKQGHIPMSENKECALFLGVHVAEKVLSKVFKDVEQMPPNNPGYDFVCNKGKKIDVKSACLYHGKDKNPYWNFRIFRNKIADYFLCIAFDNRKNLNPLYLWLLPANEINHLFSAVISPSTVNK